MQRPSRIAFIGIAASLALLQASVSTLAGGRPKAKCIEVAFVLDTTGSMAGLIDGAKRKIWSIANSIVDVNPDTEIRMALVAYRDLGDDYVVKSFEMNGDIQGLYGNLLKFQADGGGDTPESVNEALDVAVNDIQWSGRDDVRRIVFLVGDAPPHMDYGNGPTYDEVIRGARRGRHHRQHRTGRRRPRDARILAGHGAARRRALFRHSAGWRAARSCAQPL